MNIYKDASKKEANYIVVPDGDLSNSEIALMPKAPTEKVFYEILFYKRLEDNDSIVSISSNLGDTTLTLDNLEIFGKSFRFLLGGGTLGNKDILQFTLTTKNGEQRELNVTVIIAPAGVAKGQFNKEYVIGDKGQQGDAATVTVGTTTTGDAGSKATVTNNGSTSAAVLDFTIPKGDKGDTGAAGEAGSKGDTGAAGKDGSAATIAVGKTTTGDAGSKASVTNSGTKSAAIFDFTIPKGAKGDTGAAGEAGAKGDTGAAGKDGAAATIAVGKTITGDAGTDAAVANSGTSNAAIFDFTIPKGDKGDTGAAGTSYVNDGTVDLNVKSISSDGGKVKSNGGGDLITNTLLADSNIQYNALILKQSASSGEVDFNSLYGVRLNDQDSLARINLLAIIQAGSDPKTSGSITKTFHIDNDGNFLIQNGAFGVSERFPKLKDATDYDYVITVGQNNVAAIKNSKANTLTGCGYLLADQSTVTTAATGYTLAYNPTTKKVSFWNKTTWQDLMIDTSSVTYVDADQKANVDTKTLKVGAQSYDTTAKKPCWWNGTEWTDAMGNSIT